MDKIWLKQYPAGVPAEIDVNQYASLVGPLDDSCCEFSIVPIGSRIVPMRLLPPSVRSDVPLAV